MSDNIKCPYCGAENQFELVDQTVSRYNLPKDEDITIHFVRCQNCKCAISAYDDVVYPNQN